MILLVVLWSIALMTVIVVALSAFAQKSISAAGVETDRLRSELALEAGLAVACGLILGRKPEDRAYLNGTPAAADIGDGRIVEIAVHDASGLVDFNRADPALLLALTERLDLGQDQKTALQAAIKSVRQTDAVEGTKVQPTEASGRPAQPPESEQPAETSEKKPEPPALFSTAQLLSFEGVTPKVLDKLLPFITLYSSDGKVNPMAAPALVLESIPELSPGERKVLMEAAARRAGQSNAVQDILAEREAFLAIEEPRTFVIGLKILAGPGLIAGSRLTASIVLDGSGKSPFQVLAWSW